MTFELTSERLQEIAVGCVTQFISKQASLNEAIAKEAMDLELNSDQTKRVIEASNTIAYLRQLEKSADRTFEFEVADYGKVMATMCMPEDMLKAAGTPPWLDKDKDKKEDDKEDDKGKKKDPEDKDDAKEKKDKDEDSGKGKDKDEDDDKGSKDKKKERVKEDLRRVKEDIARAEEDGGDSDDEDSDDDSEEDKQEKRAMLMKGYFKAVNTLEKMAYDEAGLYMELIRVAGVVGKDPVALEKIAYVVDSQDRDKALKLCGIEKRAAEDVVFTDKELVDVKSMYSLYKQAGEFAEKKNELHDFAARAEELLFHKTANVEKLAGIGNLVTKGLSWAAGGIAHGVGSLLGKTVSGVGGAAAGAVKDMGSFGRAASQAGYKSTGEGVNAYDNIRKTQGSTAAQAKFGGNKPSVLAHRIGIGGVLTASTGLGMEHKNNVRDL